MDRPNRQTPSRAAVAAATAMPAWRHQRSATLPAATATVTAGRLN